jgi:hypothetical protein
MDTYDVKLIQQPTGRVHNVVGAGIQPILDETTGQPETEYALVAEVNGHYVTLATYTAGHVAHQVSRPDTAIADSSSSSSSDAAPTGQAPIGQPEQPEAPAEGQGTAGEGAAQPQAPQPAG